MRRTLLSTLAVALTGVGTVAAPAGAATICVNRASTGCTVFQPQTGTPGDQLQAAIAAAGGTAADDTLLLGAGTYLRAGGFSYLNGQGTLFVQGNAVADTLLQNSTSGTTIFGAATSGAMTLRDMTIEAPDAVNGTAVQFLGDGSRVVAAHVRATPGSPRVTTGVSGSNYSVSDVAIDGGIYDGLFATGGTSLGVYDTTIDGRGDGIRSYADVTTVKRVDVTARGSNGFAFWNVGGVASVENSVLVATSASNGKAVESQCSNPDSATTSVVHVTLKSPAAAGIGAFCPTGGLTASIAIKKSVIAPGTVLDAAGDGGGNESVTISESRWDGPSPGATAGVGMRTDDPQFLSATDLRLAATSPLVDLTPVVGNPTFDPNLGDLTGAPRVADGNGDGAAASDLGAYELQPAAVALPTDNLLANPGAEAGAAAFDQVAAPLPTVWTRTAGALTEAFYGSSLFPLANVGVANGAGGALFVGGPNAALSTAEQTASLAGKAAEIDGGRVTASLTGLLGGRAGEDDRASVTATFMDAGGAPLATPLTIGPTPASSRGGGVILLRRSATLAVPPGTRSVRTVMRAERSASGDSYNDASFDNLALATTTAAAPTPPGGSGTTGGGTGGAVTPGGGTGGGTPGGGMTGGGTAGGGTGSGGPPPTLSAYRGLRLTGGRVRVDRGSITTKVFCSSSAVSRCAGTVYLERRVRKGKRFATIRLGRARAAVRAGRTASLRMRVSLSRKDLKLVHRSKLKLVLRSVTKDNRPGATSTTTRKTVTLIPRRAKKGK